MTVAFGEINLQSKHDLICHVAKMKASTSGHSMADVIPLLAFLAYFLFPFEYNALIKPKENMFYTQIKKTISVTLSVYYNVSTVFRE